VSELSNCSKWKYVGY